MARVARLTDGWHPTGIPLAALPEMFASIQSTADDAGRDGSALKLVVRANGGLTDDPLGDDRSDFWGTPEQIGADIARAREIGTHELLFDFTFDPDVKGVDDFVGYAVSSGMSVVRIKPNNVVGYDKVAGE